MFDKFLGTLWKEEINVENFIETNYKEYKGDDSFLAPISNKTKHLQEIFEELKQKELEKGILDPEGAHV